MDLISTLRSLRNIPGFTLICAVIAMLCACGGKYTATPLEQASFLKRVRSQSRSGITVSVVVLSREESEEVFGVDLAAHGVQPVWIDIENNTKVPYLFMPIALDPDYFSPREVAFMSHFKFNGSANRAMDEQFSKNAIEIEFIMPGERDRGFVYTNLDPGIKFVNVALYQISGTENFFFYFDVPGIQPDYHNVDFASLYTKDNLVNIKDENELRKALEGLPCCTTGEDGVGRGEPLNIVFIGKPDDISSAIVRRKWDVSEAQTKKFTPNLRGAFSQAAYRTFPMASQYMYDRRQDMSLQKSRRTSDAAYRQRNTLRLWLTPLRYKGETVWVGTVSRDMGSDLRIRKYWFAAQEIDPDIDDARDYLVEDLILSQNVYELGFVKGAGEATPERPNYNLNNLPWWTDGYRAVFLFGDEQINLSDIKYFDWEDMDVVYGKDPGEGNPVKDNNIGSGEEDKR